jgi:DNA-binding response OmpR family regulator
MPKILIVEDYQSLLKIYDDEFKRNGFETVLAKNGEEGIKLAKAEDFDVILLDLLMPQADGFTFLKDYSPGEPNRAKVIILSNIYSTELVNEALSLGAKQYLLKADITPERIREIVNETLDLDKNIKA